MKLARARQAEQAEPTKAAAPVIRRAWAFALMLLWLLAMLALWETLAWFSGQRQIWMVLAIAVCSALSLKIGGWPRQPSRVAIALTGSALGIFAGLWLLAVLPIGAMMGQPPWIAAGNMGPDLAWTLTRLGSTPIDWTLTALAMPLAAWLAR